MARQIMTQTASGVFSISSTSNENHEWNCPQMNRIWWAYIIISGIWIILRLKKTPHREQMAHSSWRERFKKLVQLEILTVGESDFKHSYKQTSWTKTRRVYDKLFLHQAQCFYDKAAFFFYSHFLVGGLPSSYLNSEGVTNQSDLVKVMGHQEPQVCLQCCLLFVLQRLDLPLFILSLTIVN